MKFADKLDILIARAGLSQGKVASRADLSRTAVSDMTAGKRRPYLDQGFRLARALGVSLDFLADDELDEPPPPAVSDEEMDLLRLVRGLHGGVAEATERILNPARLPAPSPGWVGVAVQDRNPSTRTYEDIPPAPRAGDPGPTLYPTNVPRTSKPPASAPRARGKKKSG